MESRYLAEFLESQKSDLLRETNADRDHGRKEGNEGSAVVWSARHERCGRRAAGTPTPQSHHARRDGDATTPPPHGPPPTVRPLRCRAGLGLSASVKRATWAWPSQYRRGSGLSCLRAARRSPTHGRGMMRNAERRWRGWGHGFLASAVQHEWDGDSTSTSVQ